MKKNLSRHFAMIGTAFLVSAFAAFPTFAVTHSGFLDSVSDTAISGWAWDSETPNSAVSVELTISGEACGPNGCAVYTVPADQFRDDLNAALGSGSHGFSYTIDWSTFTTGEYTVTASAVTGETKTPLIGTLTYKKEFVPVSDSTDGPVPNSVPTSAQVPNSTAVTGPTPDNSAASISGPIPDNSSATSIVGPTQNPTPDQTAFGPGYANNVSSNINEDSTPAVGSTYGPGGLSYEIGVADQYLGSFHATAYCGCVRCSGGHALTYSGTVPKPNHTIAADLDRYPIGTKLMINGIVYTVEDRGSNVVDNRIDIFFATHAEALAFGLQNVDVYSVK